MSRMVDVKKKFHASQPGDSHNRSEVGFRRESIGMTDMLKIDNRVFIWKWVCTFKFKLAGPYETSGPECDSLSDSHSTSLSLKLRAVICSETNPIKKMSTEVIHRSDHRQTQFLRFGQRSCPVRDEAAAPVGCRGWIRSADQQDTRQIAHRQSNRHLCR